MTTNNANVSVTVTAEGDPDWLPDAKVAVADTLAKFAERYPGKVEVGVDGKLRVKRDVVERRGKDRRK